MRRFILTGFLVLALASPGFAQTILNNTTLAAALDNSQTTVRLTSATTVAVGQLIVVPGISYEAMRVTAVSGNTVSVVRGVEGTRTWPHAVSQTVFTGAPNRFKSAPPADPAATCVRASVDFLPWVDLTSGAVWTCGTLSTSSANIWRGAYLGTLTYGTSFLPVAAHPAPPEGLMARLGRRW